MAELSEAALKAFFNTGDKPTESQFADFIESYSNTIDKGAAVTKNFGEHPNQATTGVILEQLSSTHVIAADTLNTNFQSIRITAWGLITANNNLKTIGIGWNGIVYSVTLPNVGTNLNRFKLDVVLMRLTANSQSVIINAVFSFQSVSGGTPRAALHLAQPAADLTVNQDISIWAQTAVIGELTLRGWLLEILR